MSNAMKNRPEFEITHPRIPSSFELAGLADQVLSDWAFMGANPAGRPAPGPAPMNLEFGVALKGPIQCLLVLRCNRGLAEEIAQASTGDPGAREFAEDAFREFCSLYAGHLLTHFFGGNRKAFEPFLPRPMTPDEWPPVAPEAQSLIVVGHHLLELRAWLDFPDAEFQDGRHE